MGYVDMISTEIDDMMFWMDDIALKLDQIPGGVTMADLETALKKHQADILPREERFRILTRICGELSAGNYHEADGVLARYREIAEKWAHLLSVLEAKRKQIMGLNDLMGLLRDIDTLSSELKHLEVSVEKLEVTEDFGTGGLSRAISELSMVEAMAAAKGLDTVSCRAQLYIHDKGEQHEIVQRKLEDVNAQYGKLRADVEALKATLAKADHVEKFVEGYNEEMKWLAEKESLCGYALQKGDIADLDNISRLHKTIESGMDEHCARINDLIGVGKALEDDGTIGSYVQGQVREMVEKRRILRATVSALPTKLTLILLANRKRQIQKYPDPDTLADKLELLALTELILAEEEFVTGIIQNDRRHGATDQEELCERWNGLKSACTKNSSTLEDVRDLLRFKQLVVRTCVRIKMAHSGDIGIQIGQLDGTSTDKSFDENTLQKINELGAKLVRQGRSSQKEVYEQKTIINQSWQALQYDIRAYREQLKAALDAHGLDWDVNEHIHEKILAVKSDFFGRADEPTSANRIKAKLCNDLRELRTRKLLDFVRSGGELITWINAKLQLAYDESYLDPAKLLSKLQDHLAFDSELAENEKRLNFVVNEGNKLIKENHFSQQEVEAQLSELKEVWEELRNKSAFKMQRLREAYDAFTLARKVDDAERRFDHIEDVVMYEPTERKE